jgi:putative membrane protein
MNRSTFIVLSAAAVALASCGQKPTTSETSTTDTTTTNTVSETIPPDTMNAAGTDMMNAAAPVPTGQAFANTVAASDAFEIESSKLAAANAGSAAVKSYAKRMITAHTESTAKLKKLASGKPAITPDPTLNPDEQQKIDTLKALKGADFDRAYVADQIAAHEHALEALNGYAPAGDVPEFKKFATSLVPTVTAHLNMAKALKP